MKDSLNIRKIKRAINEDLKSVKNKLKVWLLERSIVKILYQADDERLSSTLFNVMQTTHPS